VGGIKRREERGKGGREGKVKPLPNKNSGTVLITIILENSKLALTTSLIIAV